MHLVDVSGASARDPVEDFEAVQRELSHFSAALGAKPQLVAATKIDALSDHDLVDRLQAHVESLGLPCVRISAVSGDGISPLLEMMWRYLLAAPPTPEDSREPAGTAGAAK